MILTGTVLDDLHKSLANETVAGFPNVQSVDDRLKIKGESPAQHSDAWITKKVQTNLMFYRQVSFDNTEVSTQNGIVWLRGTAANQAQKDLTTEYAKDVDGVKEVKNEMTLSKDYSKPKQTLGEKIDDASITAQIKLALFYRRSTSALNTKVETNNGVVTLSGIAKNKAQKALVSKLTYDVKGVENVNNQMIIEKK